MNWISWGVGLVVGLAIGPGLGYIFVPKFRSRLWQRVKEGVPGWLMGLVERTFFVLIIAFEVSGAAPAMIAWIALKTAINWQRRGIGDELVSWIRETQASVLTSLVSMLMALPGGLICRGIIKSL